MGTEFISSLGTATIALFHRQEEAANHLRGYLLNKGYQVEEVDDPPTLISVARQGTSDVVVVVVSSSLEEVSLCQILKEGDDPPPVVALCDRAGQGALESQLAEAVRPDRILVRPVPFVHILGEIEKLLQVRAKLKVSSGARPMLPFAVLLADLWGSKRTGRLQVSAEGVQTTIYLRDGVPVFAEQGSLGDTLGRMLIRTKRITNQQFSQAVNLITDRMVDNEQMRLGEALVELGVLTAQDIDDALREQVRNKILSCFLWQRMHSDFKEGEEHLEGVGDFAGPVEVLLVQGVKTIDPGQLKRYLASASQRYPSLDQPYWDVAKAFGLQGKEQSFLMTITGAKTVDQLRQRSMLDAVHCDQVLAALLLGGAVLLGEERVSDTVPVPPAEVPDPRRKKQPTSATRKKQPTSATRKKQPTSTTRKKQPTRPKAQAVGRVAAAARRAVKPSKEDPKQGLSLMALYLRVTGKADHDVLRVGANASHTEIEEAFAEQSRQVATALKNRKLDEDTIQRGKDAATQLRAARDRLLSGRPSPAAARQSAPPDETKRRLAAEQAFQEGIKLYTSKQVEAALAEFKHAAELQDDPEHQLWVSWLVYRTGKEKRDIRRAQKAALQHATQLYSQNGTNVLANLALGHLLAQQGKLERAKRHLLLAANHDTLGLVEIREELRAVDLQRTGGGQDKPRRKRGR